MHADSGSGPRLPRGPDVVLHGSRGGGACALDEETREALSALSTRLAEGFCAEISGLGVPARAAVLRGFLASVREGVGDQVRLRTCPTSCGRAHVRGCRGSSALVRKDAGERVRRCSPPELVGVCGCGGCHVCNEVLSDLFSIMLTSCSGTRQILAEGVAKHVGSAALCRQQEGVIERWVEVKSSHISTKAHARICLQVTVHAPAPRCPAGRTAGRKVHEGARLTQHCRVQVWRDVCLPAGGAARFLHISTTGSRLATTSEAVAPSPAAAGGTPLH